jgi:DNA-binding PadR family transcriptional regulator
MSSTKKDKEKLVAGRFFSLTEKGRRAFRIWSKHLEEIKDEFKTEEVV